jgi:tetratricopeptide (TPR) repeat protein
MRITLIVAAALIAVIWWFFPDSREPQTPPVAEEQPTQEIAHQPEPAQAPTAQQPPEPKLKLAAEPTFETDEDVKRAERVKFLFVTGDFHGALALAEGPGKGPSWRSWQDVQMPVLLTSAGWASLRLGNCDEAVALFRRALEYPRTPEVSKGLAYCLYKQANLLAAQDEFQEYFRLEQEFDPQMRLVYADILESEARYDEAIQALEKAANATNSGDEAKFIAERIAAMRKRAQEGLLQAADQSVNFRLTFRLQEHQEVSQFVGTFLEDALDQMIANYGFKPPKGLIEVVLYENDSFAYINGGPRWAEGLFDGRMRIPIRPGMRGENDYGHLPTILRHELVHALFAQMSDNRRLPPWFDEGLAQRFACGEDRCLPFQFPNSPGALLGETELTTPFVSLDSSSAARAYRQSLYIIIYLENTFGADALRLMVDQVTPGGSLDSSQLVSPLGKTFAQVINDVQDAWRRQVNFIQ